MTTTFITAADIPEADLSEAPDPERVGPCTCHVVREGAGGISYSAAVLGVNCGSCEALMDDYGHVSRWNSLTRDERIAELVQLRNSISEYKARRAAAATDLGGEEPPF